MKYLRARKGTSITLIVLFFILGVHLITLAAADSSSKHARLSSSSSKKINSESHLSKVKPESRASKSSHVEHQVAVQAASDKKQADITEAQESSLVPVAASGSAGPSSSASASASQSSSSSASSEASSAIDNDEYVQIKPEEISAEQTKRLESLSGSSAGQQAIEAEHKSSVDDELSAQLAHDTIHQQESAQQTYAAPAPRSSGPTGYHRPRPAGHGVQRSPYKMAPRYRQQGLRSHRGLPSGPRVPPHYQAMKGKLTGINPIISQYPHPAPGYPHHGPRHLPRGAAAGYAAFRDFVRAHANKYKHSGPAQGPYAPQEVGPVVKDQSGYRPMNVGPYSNSVNKAPGYGQDSARTKVTVTQAFIPHLAQAAQQGYGPQQAQQYLSPYNNPMLAKLYGGHAPQGLGRPEYSKDYGMVIHYPQATVYTEPMTVDQLYKLTGGGISQVIEQLQHNLANGYKNEANMISAHNKHHIGNGVTIHAKSYHAPGKSGQYVPTTAAVISTNSEPINVYGPAEQQGQADLGSGYDRVRQAAANDQSGKYGTPSEYQQSRAPSSYGQVANGDSSSKYNGEPLSSIGGMIGAELESLYKANHALTKQLEPEIHAQIQSFIKSSSHANQPLKYADLDQRSPFVLEAQKHMSGHKYQHPQQARGRYPGSHRNAGPKGHRKGHQSRSNRYSHRPQPMQHRPAQQGPYQLPQQQQIAKPQYQQQQQNYQHMRAYQAAEQALNHQMSQLLQDFHQGEDQYNNKNQPMHATNQGYPQKVLQKHHQMQQQYQHQPQSYNLHEGLEIPQGPNDQVGEIADLLEALKGSLELNGALDQHNSYNDKQQTSELTKDVRFLASALGQTPSYAMQVPVGGAHTNDQKVYQSEKKTSDSYQQQSELPQQDYQPSKHVERQNFQHSDGYAQAQPSSSQLGHQQQVETVYAPQQTSEYSHQSADNQQQQQHGQTNPQPQAYQEQPVASNPQSGSYGSSGQSPVASGSYPQSAPATQASHAGGQSSDYSSSEHTSIINHLVPTDAAASYQPTSGQSAATTSEANQPANQIAVAAPTDSQYQNAQSLSSFVDSLPTDYQELLRQPALVSGHSSVPHLAALGHEAPASSYTNATSAQTAPDHSAATHQTQAETDQSSQQQHDQLQATYQQQAQQASAPAENAHEAQQPSYRKA